MLVKVDSIVPYGVEILRVVIETNVSSKGFPTFDIVGLPGKELNESKHRILTALQNSKIDFPSRKTVINLAPANVPKQGSFYDFPIAVSLLSHVLKLSLPLKSVFFGELSLDGSLNYTSGAFLAALFAKQNGYLNVFVPQECFEETNVIDGVNVVGVKSISEFVQFLVKGKFEKRFSGENASKVEANIKHSSNKFEYISGQYNAKRAMVISAAGGHNLLLEGPPGAGKTILSKAYASILPNLTQAELLEMAKLYALKGENFLSFYHSKQSPYRSPHHTISQTGMLGGGTIPKPGEISLAHNGVLFMDEFPEFSRSVMESLRQPLEEGEIVITRNLGSFSFPAQFILIAACNPCFCGYFGHSSKNCVCTLQQLKNYQKRLSGPIVDRIDLHVFVKPVALNELSKSLTQNDTTYDTQNMHFTVLNARKIQQERFRNTLIKLNARMSKEDIKMHCPIKPSAKRLLDQAYLKLNLSARGYYKLIKIARTIADISGDSQIQREHVSEAIHYRKRN